MMSNRVLFVVLIVLGMMSMDSAAQDDAGWSLTEIQLIEDVVGHPVICPTMAPDGSAMAWIDLSKTWIDNSGICVLLRGDSVPTCHSWPDTTRGTMTLLVWSPDSRSIAFTEDTLYKFVESDVWTLDIESGTFTDHTDDGIEGSALGIDSLSQLDYSPA